MIFKCINNIIRPIFNKKITKKCNLWDREEYIYARFTIDKVGQLLWAGKKKKKRKTWRIKFYIQTSLIYNFFFFFGVDGQKILYIDQLLSSPEQQLYISKSPTTSQSQIAQPCLQTTPHLLPSFNPLPVMALLQQTSL